MSMSECRSSRLLTWGDICGWAVCILAFTWCCICLFGCQDRPPTSPQTTVQVDNQNIPLTPGQELEYHNTTTGEAGGASLTTTAADQTANFKTEAPSLNVAGDTGNAGGSSAGFSLKGIKFLDGTFVFALAFFGAAGYCLYRTPPQVRAAIMCVSAGAAVLLLPAIPWFVWALVLAGGLVYLWSEHEANKAKTQLPTKSEALRATLAAVNALPEAARSEFNRLLARDHADEQDLATIQQVRKDDNLLTQ